MEDVAAQTQGGAPEGAPSTPPTPSPAPTPTPTPTPMPTPPPSNEGGSANFGEFLKNNALLLGFGILGSVTLYWAIWYYKNNVNNFTSFQTSIQNQIDEMKIELSDIKSI